MRGAPFVALALALSLMAGCGGDDAPEPAPTTAPTTPATTPPTPTAPTAASGATAVAVYFLRGEDVGVARRSVPATRGVAAAAMRELLSGPNASERAAGLGTAVPAGTRLLGVEISGGVATVDLSERYASGGGSLSMFTRLAQVVYTLTGFPTVRSVRFRLDGAPVTVFSSEGISLARPQTRADYEDQTPAILVERPAVGDRVTTPLRLTGTANVFEATVSYEVRDGSGRPVTQGFTTATCGTGCRGVFDTKIAYRATGRRGTLRVFEVSAKDGSRVNEVRIPLVYAAGAG